MTRDKVMVIAGASSGIGAALTKALAGDGHALFVCARRQSELVKSTQDGKLADFTAADVSSEDDVSAFASHVAARSEKIDALICCAGSYGPIGPFHESDGDQWWAALKVNLFGTFLLAKYFVPLMIGRKGARIITFSGGGAFNPLPRYSAYATAKAGIVRLTETMAEELRPEGIAVNSVAPGFVNTAIHDATLEAGPKAAGEDFFAMTKDKLAKGSVPMEVPVGCVRYLLSDAADGLTGKTLSASYDPWGTPEFAEHLDEVNGSELYTMRRINLRNLEDGSLLAVLNNKDQERP